MNLTVKPGQALKGKVMIPGDKSISHRSIMCAALAEGNSVIRGFLKGDDCLATLNAFSKMGVNVDHHDDEIVVHGVGLRGLKKPDSDIYFGNSGTSIRLMSGLLCGQSFSSTLKGDASLSSRPMERIVTPLTAMGANISSSKGGNPPLEINPSERLKAFSYELPIASAQVKSCLMFAGLYADGPVVIKEKIQTRDHTELMFKKFGINVFIEESEGLKEIRVLPPKSIDAAEINIPGDFSSAAFFVLAALITPGSDLTLMNIGINKTRIALLEALKEMGADIKLSNVINEYEPCADISIKASKLKGITLNPKLIPNLIDELPVLFIAASLAEGQTIIRGAEELREKESDRLEAMSNSLKMLRVKFKMYDDGIDIQGLNQEVHTSNSGMPFMASRINSFGDHRIAMTSAIACTRANDRSYIEDTENVTTSFPNFLEICEEVGLDIK